LSASGVGMKIITETKKRRKEKEYPIKGTLSSL
jgi:hypothetical protein